MSEPTERLSAAQITAAPLGCVLAECDQLRAERQRLHDLVRYKRMELHADDLISDEEYAELLSDHGSVARLEGYDKIRARMKAAEAEAARLRAALNGAKQSVIRVKLLGQHRKGCAAVARNPNNPWGRIGASVVINGTPLRQCPCATVNCNAVLLVNEADLLRMAQAALEGAE